MSCVITMPSFKIRRLPAVFACLRSRMCAAFVRYGSRKKKIQEKDTRMTDVIDDDLRSTFETILNDRTPSEAGSSSYRGVKRQASIPEHQPSVDDHHAPVSSPKYRSHTLTLTFGQKILVLVALGALVYFVFCKQQSPQRYNDMPPIASPPIVDDDEDYRNDPLFQPFD